MEFLKRLSAVCCILCWVDVSTAQWRTTIQLPTFQNFSMSTTVVVPDGGRVYAGGINRSFQASSRRRSSLLPSLNRSYSGGTSGTGVWVSAHIHHLEEMDEAVLDDWSRIKTERQNALPARRRLARRRTLQTQISQPIHRLPRVSDVRKQVQAEDAAKLARAHADFRLGVRLEQKGKIAAAQAMYRNALKRADDDLMTKISSHLNQLKSLHIAASSPATR